MIRISEFLHVKNKTGSILLDGLTVNITVLDIRECFGNIQYLIMPVSGSGSCWVNASRVTIQK